MTNLLLAKSVEAAAAAAPQPIRRLQSAHVLSLWLEAAEEAAVRTWRRNDRNNAIHNSGTTHRLRPEGPERRPYREEQHSGQTVSSYRTPSS
jgi:hypothetical protein